MLCNIKSVKEKKKEGIGSDSVFLREVIYGKGTESTKY